MNRERGLSLKPMTQKLMIALASAVLLLASVGGHAFAIPGDPCIPSFDDSSSPI